MACLVKVGNKFENLSGYNTFIKDTHPNSRYFKVTKFKETFTAGKNLFLMEGSEFLKESTDVKIEITDVNKNTIYVEPGRGVPDYYEGNSVVLSAHIYDNIPVGPAKITILGELREYIDNQGIRREVPEEWRNVYNVKWEKDFYINKNLLNDSPVIFYKKPVVKLEERTATINKQTIPTVIQSGSVRGFADIPELGTDIRNWRAGSLYRLEITDTSRFTASIDENIIEIPSLNYEATVKEVLNSTTVLVDKPYLVDNIVSTFNSSGYTSSFEYFDGRTTEVTETTGSYQRLVLDNLDTFTGNVDTIRIYRKSRSDISDFKFLEEIRIEDITDEILVDETKQSHETDGGFGRLTEANIIEYWTTSSITIGGTESTVTFDSDLLFEAIKINVPSSSYATSSVTLTTDEETTLVRDVDYEVKLKTLISGSFKDVIPGEVTEEYEPYSITTYYLYDESKLKSYPISYITSSGYDDLLFQSSSRDLRRNYIYDDTRLDFFDTLENTTGSILSEISSSFSYDTNLSTTLTLDTSSTDWGDTSRQQTGAEHTSNIISVSSSFAGEEFVVNVWLDSGSYNIPHTTDKNIEIYSEVFVSSSESQLLLAFESIGGDAKFYYYHSSNQLDELASFRNSVEYPLDSIDSTDYNDDSTVTSWTTGSQVIIPFTTGSYNYIHLDYRTKRNTEPLNAQLITVEKLNRLNGDVLYGESYNIESMNFQTGRILFTDGTDASFSGTLSVSDGELVLELDGDTQTLYLVEADFNNDIMVFIGRITLGELEPDATRYNTYELFQLSGSVVENTTTASYVIPRVPTRAGDNLYTENGYPFIGAEVPSTDFLTAVFDSPSSSLDIETPLEIPYVFRNDGSEITDVYTFDSSSGQIYNVSSVSSSTEVNADTYVYGTEIVQEGFVLSGSLNDIIYMDESEDSDTYQGLTTDLVNFTYKQHDFVSGSIIISLLTDSGSTELPTGTGSVEYYIETFASESGEGSGVEIWRNAFGFRNFDTDGMLYYNHSEVSQSAMDSYSGSVNYTLSEVDVSDFKEIPIRILESGSQAIIDVELSGSGYNYIYLDYRTRRYETPLNADLHDLGIVNNVNGDPITTALETFPLSGSEVSSYVSSSMITPRLPIRAGEYLYDFEVDYPFYGATTTSDGTFIGDTDTPNQREYVSDVYNIPYVFTMTDGKINEVIVKRIDSVFTASSEYGTAGTFVTESGFTTTSLVDPDTDVFKTIEVFFTGSSGSIDFEQKIIAETASADYSSRQDLVGIVTSDYTSTDARFGIRVRGDGWLISNVSARPAASQGFVPKTFKTLQEEPRNLPEETFDYKFELYDVNNNYIPLKLTDTVEFTGGNQFGSGQAKIDGAGERHTISRFKNGVSIENSTITNSDTETMLTHANNGGTIFTISGSNGELLKITDTNSSSLLEVNDASGIDVFTISSDGEVTASGMSPITSSTYDLGSTDNRWRTLFTQNTVNVSDVNQKNSIIDTDLGLPFINSLRPVKYKWNKDIDTIGFHYGLIAQEVSSSLSDLGYSTDDVAFVHSSSKDLMLSYTELLSPMIAAIKELSNKVNQLEQQISGSN